MQLESTITEVAELEALYRPPGERAASKVRDRIDPASARFIDHCTFLVLATSDRAGAVDASPRGGPPGFVHRLDDRHVAIADLIGNNRLDSFRNIVANPYAGLLLVVPGKDETLRITGPARLTTDATLLGRLSAGSRPPTLALVVEVAELFGHCAKAFRRGGVWDSRRWDTAAGAPDLAEIYSCQFDGTDASELRRSIDAIYDEHLREE